ncbi:IucA/IucC family C-terminal-domain containing protein [Streptomyces vinaceus]|uniref:IucA/IucC family C-terminal-domain containing protein n=1 Tax=Streptomyces vinaceus TaxID=1960 RepID=UPI0035DBC816
MRLDQLLSDPLGAMLHLERWCNDGSPSGLSFGAHQVAVKHRPREGEPDFSVPTYAVPWERAELSLAAPSPEVAAAVLGDRGPLLAVHPDNPVAPPWPAGPALRVVPTASARTVVALEPEPVLHVKLHYPGLLGRVPRELDAHRVRASVRMSSALEEIRELLPQSCAYLAETVGVVARVDGSDLGVVYRETLPRHCAGGPRGAALVPFFALFSTDLHAPDDPPLLVQLLDHGAPERGLRALLDLVLESYAALVFGQGLVPEDHAQNLLLQLDGDGRPVRIVRRDLLDWYADLEIRRRRGLPTDFVRALDVSHDAERAHGGRSYAFDFRLGDYILDPVLECAARYLGVDRDATTEWIRQRVHALAAHHDIDLKHYFQPYDQTYRYERSLRIWQNSRPLFHLAGPPTYR